MPGKIKIKQISDADLQRITDGGNSLSNDIQINGATHGFLLTADDNFKWRVTINDEGQLLAEQIIPSTILDVISVTASFAWSTRQLNSNVDLCIRLRRGSDNVERDFYYINGVLDLKSILYWSKKSEVYIVTFYDSSGNSNDATELDTALQEKWRSGNFENDGNKNPISANILYGVYLSSIGNRSYDLTTAISNNQDIDAYVLRELISTSAGTGGFGSGYFGSTGNVRRGLIKINSVTPGFHYRRGSTDGFESPSTPDVTTGTMSLLNTSTDDSLSQVEFFQNNISLGTDSTDSASDNDVLFGDVETAWVFELIRFDGILNTEEKNYYIQSVNDHFGTSF